MDMVEVRLELAHKQWICGKTTTVIKARVDMGRKPPAPILTAAVYLIDASRMKGGTCPG